MLPANVWMLSLLASLWCLQSLLGLTGSISLWRRILAFVFLCVFVSLAVYYWPTVITMEKLATHAALPCGLLWLLMVLTLFVSRRKASRKTQFGLLCMLMIFTAMGNFGVSNAVQFSLEIPYADIDPLEQGEFDTVIVLGGGVGPTPTGQSQLEHSGDRVMMAARLYLQGKTKRLVTTGQNIPELSIDSVHLCERTSQIWQDLGIPPEDITQVLGRNTAEEMEELAKLIDEWRSKRVGIITSAWHMERTIRLARSHGLEFVPIPTNFMAHTPDWKSVSIIPHHVAVYDFSTAFREYLARLVRR